MGEVDIAALRELEAKATPGPWEYGADFGYVFFRESPREAREVAEMYGAIKTERLSDGMLIVATRNALPALLEAAEQRDQLLVLSGVVLDEAHEQEDRADLLEDEIARLRERDRILSEIERRTEGHTCLDADGRPGPMACNRCLDLWFARRAAPTEKGASE